MISNTSPLIAFSRIGWLAELRAWSLRLVIPSAVDRELRAGAREGEPIIEALRNDDWIEVQHLSPSPLLAILSADLGDGEAEALVLAAESRQPLIIEDARGRVAAKRLGLSYLGNLGVLREMKRMGVIGAARPGVEAFRAAGIYYGEALIERFLREEGEWSPPS